MKSILLHATDSSKVKCGLGSFDQLEVVGCTLFLPILLPLSESTNILENVVISSQQSAVWLSKNQRWLDILRDKVIFCVGLNTQKALEALGLVCHCVSENGFNGLLQHLKGRPVSFFGSVQLAEPSLNYFNHTDSNHIAVYDMQPSDKPMDVDVTRVKVVLATSPRILAAFLKQGISKDVLVLVLGKTTAEYAFNQGCTNVQIGVAGSIVETCHWFTEQFPDILDKK